MEHTHRGLSWDHKTGKGTSIMAIVALVASLFIAAASPAPAAATGTVDLIVREVNPASNTAETLIERLGGVVKANLEIIGGFTATVPASMVDTLGADPSIAAVTPNAGLQLSTAGWEPASTLGSMDPKTHPGSLYEVTKYSGARDAWGWGHTGAGVDIALIDSGVVPINGLTAPGKVVNGPDLSFESQNPDFEYLDTFGHGTHLAGIIAGRDDSVVTDYKSASSDFFVGVAPDARLVSIKVADKDGATDVSQVIAAIDWVIQNKNSGDLNIRVINLAFGTDSTQSYVLDPLALAVEKAWHAGVVVVVSAGNDGNTSALRNPATDPYVIAVGAVDPNGTSSRSDDFIAGFSNCGTVDRHVDVVAHGRSITSLRAPGSTADVNYSDAVVEGRMFLGSGTSQAAAVVSGVVALVLDAQPDLTPDEVKWMLMDNAQSLGSNATQQCEGAGAVSAFDTATGKAPKGKLSAIQKHPLATGTGTLEASRGTDHLEHDGVILSGEQDIMGNPWIGFNQTATKCSKEKGVTVCQDYLEKTDTLWNGGDWNGTSWSGTSWSGTSWSGTSWSGTSWSGLSWSGLSWSGTSWSDMAWNGTSWSGTSWSGTSWSGTSWSGLSWSSSGSAADQGLRWD